MKKGTFTNYIKTHKNALLVIIVCAVAFVVIITTTSILIYSSFRNKVLTPPLNLKCKDNTFLWVADTSAKGYVLDISGEIIEVSQNNFDMSSLKPGDYTIMVKALHKDGSKYDSDFSAPYTFTIPPVLLSVEPSKAVTLSKIYDGTLDYGESIILGTHYYLSGTSHGSDVDIAITSVKYDYQTVLAASKVIVTYSAITVGVDSKYYVLEAGEFELKARILPKELEVTPPTITKQFADADILTDIFYDTDLNKDISLKYVRSFGEMVGEYDIISAVAGDSNYRIKITENSGKGKFEIVKRQLTIKTNDVTITKVYDGTAEYFDLSSIRNGIEYEIVSLIVGFGAGINITSVMFNSANANEANSATVYFNFEADSQNDIYKIIYSSFEISAQILPKQINLFTPGFVKQFGDEEDLADTLFDTSLEQNIPIT
ncbi:MAG: hypothetical protein LBE09_08245, partial [Christensenellaceae bacterium]|nr:hypothetical protein [Christensenellaceae bacterium]